METMDTSPTSWKYQLKSKMIEWVNLILYPPLASEQVSRQQILSSDQHWMISPETHHYLLRIRWVSQSQNSKLELLEGVQWKALPHQKPPKILQTIRGNMNKNIIMYNSYQARREKTLPTMPPCTTLGKNLSHFLCYPQPPNGKQTPYPRKVWKLVKQQLQYNLSYAGSDPGLCHRGSNLVI